MIPNSKLIIYTDGGARGNPGQAAVGVVIKGLVPESVEGRCFKEYIGEATNNVAEYKAVILALKKAKEILKSKSKKTDLEMYLDSELLYKQFLGDYRVREAHLKPLFAEVMKSKENFQNVNFNLVRREKNQEADKLVNEALDEKLLKQKSP